MFTLAWVPSKKAMAAGIVPTDYSKYDITVDVDFEDADLAKVMKSVFVGAEKTVRHAYNNESASAWLAAKTRDEDPIEDTAEKRAAFLDDWRMDWRTKFINGELGLRRVSVTPPKDALTVEKEGIALGILREFAETKGVPFPYTVVNARTTAAPYGDTGRTIGEVLADLLVSKKWAARIESEAQKIIDQRAAAKAAMADESVDTLEDLLGDDDESEDEAA